MHAVFKPPFLLDQMNEEEFFLFCAANQELKIERTTAGQILIMSPTGSETGIYDSELTVEIAIWNRKEKKGKVFGSSAGFTLPDRSVKSADVAWIAKARWDAVPKADRKRFAHICPDFVAEIKSPSDSWTELQTKMHQWMENGCQLGWLIDPEEETIEIYKPETVEIGNWLQLDGEEILLGLQINLKEIFEG